jgi:outer membrane murein-binding lipoprotein Lpp
MVILLLSITVATVVSAGKDAASYEAHIEMLATETEHLKSEVARLRSDNLFLQEEHMRAQATLQSFKDAGRGADLKSIGVFKVTWYVSGTPTTGWTTASGAPVFDGCIAMNRQQMDDLGLDFGDEIIIDLESTGERKWCILLDTGCAYGVIDIWCEQGDVPARGVDAALAYKKVI